MSDFAMKPFKTPTAAKPAALPYRPSVGIMERSYPTSLPAGTRLVSDPLARRPYAAQSLANIE